MVHPAKKSFGKVLRRQFVKLRCLYTALERECHGIIIWRPRNAARKMNKPNRKWCEVTSTKMSRRAMTCRHAISLIGRYLTLDYSNMWGQSKMHTDHSMVRNTEITFVWLELTLFRWTRYLQSHWSDCPRSRLPCDFVSNVKIIEQTSKHWSSAHKICFALESCTKHDEMKVARTITLRDACMGGLVKILAGPTQQRPPLSTDTACK